MTYQKLFKALAALLMLTILISISSISFAAKKSYGVKVPASILNGSDITANRSFKTLGVKETTLGGLSLGQSGNKILQKYGNPTRVIVATDESILAAKELAQQKEEEKKALREDAQFKGELAGLQAGATDQAYNNQMGINQNIGPAGLGVTKMGGMSGAMGGTQMGGMAGGAMGGMPTAAGGNRMGGAMGGMPGAAGMGGMGIAGGAMGGAAQAGNVQAANTFLGTSGRINETTICWQYDLNSGVQLEFLVKNNKISQITVLSLYPWKSAKLKSGIMIGDTYKLTTYLWGIDYRQQAVGSFSRVTYFKNKGTAFIFLNKKLVGITIAAGEAIL